ncbi:MAG: hypothetical protein B6U76_03555 [Desulfurococcales archaeon ex4484_217_2]|nr:MAG: hypothetical protein B6U76_03555 [Desulfurococcales archaeon ex4484_217_2]
MTQGDKSPIDLPEDFHLLPFEEKAKYIVELRRRGYTYREIAKMLHVSFRDISMAIKTYGVKPVPHDELEKLKERVEDIDNNLAEAIEDVSKHENRLEHLEEVVGALASIIKGYEDFGIRSRIDELSVQMEALKREIKSLHTISARHSREEADLREDLRRLSSRIDVLRGELSRLREAHSRYERLVYETLSLLRKYMDSVYEILRAAMEHQGLKLSDTFSGRMTILNAEIEDKISELSRRCKFS